MEVSMTNKEKAQKTYEILKRRKQLREYKRRALQCDLTSLSISAVEKTSRRKIGQITRR